MKQYHDLLQHILDHGVQKADRTGTGTISTFGYQMRFDLAEGFPLVTTKKVHLKSVIHELLWFIAGDTNIKYLVENGVHIWTDWPLAKYNAARKRLHRDPVDRETFERWIVESAEFAAEWGNLGPIYGKQWAAWNDPRSLTIDIHGAHMTTINQLDEVVEQIKTNPDSRRLIVSAWNPAYVDEMALPPCHFVYQFYVQDGKLSCMMTQRSQDVFLGGPFNIASYALLTMMVAQVTDLEPGELIVSIGDAHIYLNHIEQVKLQLSREPRPLPTMHLNRDVTDLFDFKYEDFQLQNYNPHPAIKAEVAV